jgi:hypothetical protein
MGLATNLKYPAGICCLVFGCGAPPSPPGPIMTSPRAESRTGQVAVLEERTDPPATPTPRADDPEESAAADAGAAAVGSANGPATSGSPTSESKPISSERSFAACTDSRDGGCDYIYITMQGDQAASCVQLTLDNCLSYSGPGLPVDLPLSWRLASGSIGVSSKSCVPGAYNADSLPVVGAKGSIDWNRKGQQPSELVIDVTLEPSALRGGEALSKIDITTQALSAPLRACED